MSAVTVTGSVALVGAGPGDPDLLTRRAETLLAAAGTVVVDAVILHLAAEFAPTAVIVAVPDRLPAIDVLLAAAHGFATPVVRLYTGDTWLHPGHGPESAALAAAGIPHAAVPGVATEMGVPARAGIAVHVRHLAVACTIADLGEGEAPPATDPARTLVVVADDLHAAALGMASSGDPSMPAAAVEADGQSTRAALGELAVVAPRRPGVLVAGAVAAATPAEAVLR